MDIDLQKLYEKLLKVFEENPDCAVELHFKLRRLARLILYGKGQPECVKVRKDLDMVELNEQLLEIFALSPERFEELRREILEYNSSMCKEGSQKARLNGTQMKLELERKKTKDPLILASYLIGLATELQTGPGQETRYEWVEKVTEYQKIFGQSDETALPKKPILRLL